MTLVERVRPAAGEPEGALVLLHGRGADEHDLHGLLDQLDPDRRLVGVTPRGPLSLPPGGAHWYAVYRVGFPDPETFWPVFEDLCAWYDACRSARLSGRPDRARRVLAGLCDVVRARPRGGPAGPRARCSRCPASCRSSRGSSSTSTGPGLRPSSSTARRPRDRRRLRPRGPHPARRQPRRPRLPGVRRGSLGRPRRPRTAARRHRHRLTDSG